MNGTGQLLLRFGTELSESAHEAVAALLAPIVLVTGWLAAKSAIASAILASIPTPVPLTSVPSIDCLLQVRAVPALNPREGTGDENAENPFYAGARRQSRR